jgi:uncharacterized membrane protein
MEGQVNDEKAASLRTLTTVVYALQAAGFVTGGLGWIVAVVVNYVKKDEAAGTPCESHFRWQIRTFWFALAWCVAGGALALTIIGIPIAIVVFVGTGLWVLYRIVRGWLALGERAGLPA